MKGEIGGMDLGMCAGLGFDDGTWLSEEANQGPRRSVACGERRFRRRSVLGKMDSFGTGPANRVEAKSKDRLGAFETSDLHPDAPIFPLVLRWRWKEMGL